MARKSINDYPPDWPQIAQAVKEKANWRCVRCGHKHNIAAGYMLGVHHLDMNKANCRWWNLVSLCQRCHLTIQAKVVMERTWLLPHSAWFIPYAAGFYASRFGLPDDEEFVRNYADALIAIGQGKINPDEWQQHTTPATRTAA